MLTVGCENLVFRSSNDDELHCAFVFKRENKNDLSPLRYVRTQSYLLLGQRHIIYLDYYTINTNIYPI